MLTNKKGRTMKTTGVNIITIEKNVPLPKRLRGVRESFKYVFMNRMQVGDSFSVNEDHPDYSPHAVRCYVHSKRARTGSRKYATRTIKGNSKNPTAIRVWRTY